MGSRASTRNPPVARHGTAMTVTHSEPSSLPARRSQRPVRSRAVDRPGSVGAAVRVARGCRDEPRAWTLSRARVHRAPPWVGLAQPAPNPEHSSGSRPVSLLPRGGASRPDVTRAPRPRISLDRMCVARPSAWPSLQARRADSQRATVRLAAPGRGRRQLAAAPRVRPRRLESPRHRASAHWLPPERQQPPRDVPQPVAPARS